MNIIVEVTAFHGNIHVLWILSAFHGSIQVPWILSTFCGNIHVPWILSAFSGNMHILRILSARILPRLATSPVLDIVHCLQHHTTHCSTVLPIVYTQSPRRVFISVDSLRSQGYWNLIVVHLTLRTHTHMIASYPHLRTC